MTGGRWELAECARTIPINIQGSVILKGADTGTDGLCQDLARSAPPSAPASAPGRKLPDVAAQHTFHSSSAGPLLRFFSIAEVQGWRRAESDVPSPRFFTSGCCGRVPESVPGNRRDTATPDVAVPCFWARIRCAGLAGAGEAAAFHSSERLAQGARRPRRVCSHPRFVRDPVLSGLMVEIESESATLTCGTHVAAAPVRYCCAPPPSPPRVDPGPRAKREWCI